MNDEVQWFELKDVQMPVSDTLFVIPVKQVLNTFLTTILKFNPAFEESCLVVPIPTHVAFVRQNIHVLKDIRNPFDFPPLFSSRFVNEEVSIHKPTIKIGERAA